MLSKKDTLALLPTGGGKSICFQIPALLMDGICVVITPLIALMHDQIDQLSKKGIKALSIYSGMTAKEVDITLDNAVYGDYSFLYVSPERLKTDIFIERFKKMNISFIAVDEAHCISQWGYDFRPAYLQIADLKLVKPDLHFLALTATANEEVVNDIQKQLNFGDQNVLKSSFLRQNLKYITLRTENKLDDLIFLAKKMKGSGLVYCRTRRQTEEVSKHLSAAGLPVNYYHAGLNQNDRQQKQTKWMHNHTRIIVATNAFGMGIDKPDVRFVIHHDVPDNIESYFQEAGRAGRDLKKSRAILLFNDKDISELSQQVDLKYPDIPMVKQVYNALGNHFQLAIGSGKDECFDLDITSFSTKYNLNFHVTRGAIKLLENNDLLKLNDSGFRPSRLKILVDKTQLYQFQVKNEKHNRIIQFILRSHLGIFDRYLNINENTISNKVNLSSKDIVDALLFLKKQQVVDYIPQSNHSQLIYLTERLNDRHFNLSPKIYKVRKESAIRQSEAMISFLKNENCRQVFLLNYFGEFNVTPCGQCNVCLKISEVFAPKELNEKVLHCIKIALEKKTEAPIEAIFEAFPEYSRKSITQSIRSLNEENLIQLDNTGRYIST